MKHVFDPKTKMYRTERPRAGLFTYALMFLLAFIVGAGGGTFVAFRLAVPRSRPGGGYYESAEIAAEHGYGFVAACAIAGGIVAMIALASLIWRGDE